MPSTERYLTNISSEGTVQVSIADELLLHPMAYWKIVMFFCKDRYQPAGLS